MADGPKNKTVEKQMRRVVRPDHVPASRPSCGSRRAPRSPTSRRPPRKPFIRWLGVEVDVDAYHQVMGEGMRIACITGIDYPVVVDVQGRFVEFLHHVAYFRANPRDPPLEDDEVIHHRDHRKHNARGTNLVRMRRPAHAALHRRARQKLGRRKRYRLEGFWFPHHEAPVVALRPDSPVLDELRHRGLSQPKSVDHTDSRPTKEEVEDHLAAQLARLREATQGFDSKQPITPPKKRMNKSDRRAGLPRLRLACTPGEAAVVHALALHGMERAQVAAEVGLALEIIEHIVGRTAVALGIQRWLRYRRFPRPVSVKRLRRLLAAEERQDRQMRT